MSIDKIKNEDIAVLDKDGCIVYPDDMIKKLIK